MKFSRRKTKSTTFSATGIFIVFVTSGFLLIQLWTHSILQTDLPAPIITRTNSFTKSISTSSISTSNSNGHDVIIHQAETSIITQNQAKTWIPQHPWDAPPPGFYSESDTGSFQNCSQSFTHNHKPTISNNDGFITVSCHTFTFHAPIESIQYPNDIVIGVLSAASGSGPKRRHYIRSTWAKELQHGVYFLVAGPWKDIEQEFMFYKDMIWIDEDEVYQGEQSVLTYKTICFFTIVHKFARSVEQGGFHHAIKTDDDSYVNVKKFREFFAQEDHDDDDKSSQEYDYFGQCPQFQVKPSRDRKNKWPVTYTTYPEPSFPLYCQGAGFGLSRELLSCAVDQGHVEKFRYMPFEDVSIGILAERCGYKPTMIPGIKVFRADTPKERKCVNEAIPMIECYKGDDTWPPDAHMSTKLIQHRVESKDDMVRIHQSLGLNVQWVDVIEH